MYPPIAHSPGRGAWYTVREISRMLRRARGRELEAAAAAVAGCGPDLDRAARIRAWLAEHVTFQPDPPGVELVHDPRELLERIRRDGRAYGDCDDVAVLGAALGAAAGLPVQLVLLAWGPDWEHVYAELGVRLPSDSGTREAWYELDTTRPAQYARDYGAARRATVPL